MAGEISRSYQGPKDGRIPSWMEAQQNANEFLYWLAEDRESIEAEVGSPRDEKLQYFVRTGMLKFHFCAHGTNSYLLTSEWIKALA